MRIVFSILTVIVLPVILMAQQVERSELVRTETDEGQRVVKEVVFSDPVKAKLLTSTVPTDVGEKVFVSPKQSSYKFPDKKTRFYRYVNGAIGPTSFIGPAIGAGFQTAGENPPEWEKNSKGYMRRFASNVGENIIEETTKYALSEAFRQDPKYYRCECEGIGNRTVHALKSGFTARNRNGNTVFSPAKVVSPFVANVTSTTVWYPKRFTARDGLRRGGYSLAFGVGFNLVREFIF